VPLVGQHEDISIRPIRSRKNFGAAGGPTRLHPCDRIKCDRRSGTRDHALAALDAGRLAHRLLRSKPMPAVLPLPESAISLTFPPSPSPYVVVEISVPLVIFTLWVTSISIVPPWTEPFVRNRRFRKFGGFGSTYFPDSLFRRDASAPGLADAATCDKSQESM
jgi:hypothetical protein